MELLLHNIHYTSKLFEQLSVYPDVIDIQGILFKIHSSRLMAHSEPPIRYTTPQWYDIYLELEEIG